jgi:anion-transporting  ArsA/GET3 family ATPase
MERLFELVGREEYDLIILDTPPTRNALDFLDAPGRMADFFSSRFLKWLIAPSRSGVATVAAKPLTYVADKILGAAFLADITEFFLLLNSMYDGFVERARQVEALLQRETTKFMVVSSAERIPVSEASFFDSELRARDLHVAAWLVNRLSPAILSSDLDEELLGVGMAPDITTQGLAHSILGRALLEARRIALDEAEVVAEIAAGPTPVFPGYAVEGSLDNLAGVASFGHQLLDAEAF